MDIRVTVDDIVTELVDLTVKQSKEDVDDAKYNQQVRPGADGKCTSVRTVNVQGVQDTGNTVYSPMEKYYVVLGAS